jgi:hypothetical protein
VRFEAMLAPQVRDPVMRDRRPAHAGDVAGHAAAGPVRQPGPSAWHNTIRARVPTAADACVLVMSAGSSARCSAVNSPRLPTTPLSRKDNSST